MNHELSQLGQVPEVNGLVTAPQADGGELAFSPGRAQCAIARDDTAATDASSWDVTAQQDLKLSGLDATAIAATATADSAGIPVGTSRYAYLVDVGSSGTVTMWTVGTVGEGEFANDSTILSLMVSQSKFIAGP